MKIIEIVTANLTYFISVDEVAYVEYSGAPKTSVKIYFRGFRQEDMPHMVHLTGGDADSFIKKLRVAGSVY